MTVAILSLLCLASAPASASDGEQQAPPGCFGQLYSTYFGQGVAVNCAPQPEGYGYRTIAHCTSGSTFWYSFGTFVPYGFGPSAAECEGGLLTPAAVGGYHVIYN